jgi:hypothetical protein
MRSEVPEQSSLPHAEGVFKGFVPPSPDELAALEREVEAELADPTGSRLQLLGFGEMTIAIAYPQPAPRWACKRMPPARSVDVAQRFKCYVERYIRELERASTRVVPTHCQIVPAKGGRWALYLCQPIVDGALLGPNALRRRVPDARDPYLISILTAITRANTPHLAVDPQLANWAMIDGEPWMLDVSTPFMREPNGAIALDSRVLTEPYPAVIRPILRKWVVPSTVERFFDLRAAMIDFTANLYKERLEAWVGPAISAANEFLESPIHEYDVKSYYYSDKKVWDLAYFMKRLERKICKWRGVTYQFLISPRIDRGEVLR